MAAALKCWRNQAIRGVRREKEAVYNCHKFCTYGVFTPFRFGRI